jgi:hypothetical protein
MPEPSRLRGEGLRRRPLMALAGAAVDAAELLDVDVDQLAGDRAFVAVGGLEPEAAELAHPDPDQDPRDRRQRPVEDLGDLGSVNRRRRKAAIAWTVCSSVRLATTAGADG